MILISSTQGLARSLRHPVSYSHFPYSILRRSAELTGEQEHVHPVISMRIKPAPFAWPRLPVPHHHCYVSCRRHLASPLNVMSHSCQARTKVPKCASLRVKRLIYGLVKLRPAARTGVEGTGLRARLVAPAGARLALRRLQARNGAKPVRRGCGGRHSTPSPAGCADRASLMMRCRWLAHRDRADVQLRRDAFAPAGLRQANREDFILARRQARRGRVRVCAPLPRRFRRLAVGPG